MHSRIISKLGLMCCLLVTAGSMYGCDNGGGGGAGGVTNPTQTTVVGQASKVDPTNIQSDIRAVSINSPPVITFTLLDEKGAPLDPNDIIKAGGRVSFTIAQLDAKGVYHNYIKAATAGQPGFDSGGTFGTVGTGVYSYTFKTDITDATKTLNSLVYDRTLPHTVSAQIQRTSDGNGQAVNPYFTFRPNGAAVNATEKREIVAISNCNDCHSVLRAHGGGRRELALCILCHNSGVIDPETGNSIDMTQIIHKIHMGKKLPSFTSPYGASGNRTGGAYMIVGFNNSFNTYTTVTYPFISADSLATSTPIKCTKCHKLGTDLSGNAFGAKADNYFKAAPSKEKCSSCHDTVVYDGTSTKITVKNGIAPVSVTAVRHNNNSATAVTDTDCVGCHAAGTPGTDEYNATVIGAHTVIEESTKFTGVNFKIVSIANAKAGQKPAVTFKITNNAGASIDPNSGSFNLKFGYIPTGSADYTNAGLLPDFNPNSNPGAASGVLRGTTYNNPAQPLTMPMSKVATQTDPPPVGTSYVSGLTTALPATPPNADGSYTLAFDEALVTNPTTAVYSGGVLQSTGSYAIPASLTGIGVIGLEGRKAFTIPATQAPHRAAARNVNIGGQSDQYYFDLATGAQITDPTKQRRNVVDISKCLKCHSRLSFHGSNRVNSIDECVICHNPALIVGGEIFDFKFFIHQLHAEGFPNIKGNCMACHISESTFTFPLAANRIGTSWDAGPNLGNASDDTKYGPLASACNSCHLIETGPQVLDHTGPMKDNEICINCHGTKATKDVLQVHPIRK